MRCDGPIQSNSRLIRREGKAGARNCFTRRVAARRRRKRPTCAEQRQAPWTKIHERRRAPGSLGKNEEVLGGPPERRGFGRKRALAQIAGCLIAFKPRVAA